MSIRRVSLAAVVAFVALACVAATQAASVFSARTLRGTYGISGSGSLAYGTIPAAFVGLNSFDRGGRCVITATLNAGGEPASLTTARCKYSVNPDGTGSLDVTFNEPQFQGPFHSDFVILDGARELHFVLSDPGRSTLATGVAKPQWAAE